MTTDAVPAGPLSGSLPETDLRLLARLRQGDEAAGRQFVRDFYPAIYRYLLHLTGHRESAEDLAQETFLQAWRHLDQFEGRAPLRIWLHAIARREFLRARRQQQSATSLEEFAEFPEPHARQWVEEAEVRVLLEKLPEEHREALLLSIVSGCSSSEIARILQAPARTIRHRLALARAQLARMLGPGDLAYLNEPSVPMRPWAWLPLEQMRALEARLSRADETKENPMERRELLRNAALGAAGLILPETDREVVDERLSKKVTLAFKGAALSDLCDHLAAQTGITIAAGASVADEKVTIFCKAMPLRDVMRQLSRPFGYTWVRGTRNGEYRYELLQDLRSQLLEEELRNRERNEALLALEQEIEKYRPYLSLSPDEVLARARTAPPAEKAVLENLGGGRPGLGLAWGITQIYFRLTPQDLARLRAGEELAFSQEPLSGEKTLPPDVARGVLQSLRTWRLLKTSSGYAQTEPDDPRGIPLSAVPEARALVNIKLSQTELGEFGLQGLVGFYAPTAYSRSDHGPYAVGRSPRTLQPQNAVINAKFGREPALRRRVSIQPQPSYRRATDGERGREGEAPAEPKVTTADVLEALHQATGMPIVSDFYTRLYKPEPVTCENQSLFDGLNSLCDGMGMRWNREDAWLQFRSVTYYHDRLKEVPNRFLNRWASARRERGMLTLEELIEMAQMPDAQLKASSMAEGIREWWGLPEWDLARDWLVLPNLRFLALLTPAQREEAQSPGGLLFTKMTLAQQQAFYGRRLPGQPELRSLEDLIGTALRVDYTQPGGFEWQPAGKRSLRWAVRPRPGKEGQWLPVPVVRERTREAARQALSRIDPQIREAVRATAIAEERLAVEPSAAVLPPEEAQIGPTELNLATIYIPGSARGRLIYWMKGSQGVSDLD